MDDAAPRSCSDHDGSTAGVCEARLLVSLRAYHRVRESQQLLGGIVPKREKEQREIIQCCRMHSAGRLEEKEDTENIRLAASANYSSVAHLSLPER